MSILMTPKHTHARKHTSARTHAHARTKKSGKYQKPVIPMMIDFFIEILGQRCLYRTFWSTSLVVTNDSIRGCFHPSVSPSVCPSIRPSIRPSVGNTNFWLAKKGQKWDQWWRGGQRLDESQLILCIRSCFHGKRLISRIWTCSV